MIKYLPRETFTSRRERNRGGRAAYVGTVARFSRLWYLRRKYYPMFTDSLARKTRSTLDFLINQSRRALKRYNVILAMERERRTTGGRERGKGKRAAKNHLTAFIARALTSSLETTQTTANTRRTWRDDWQTLAPGATKRRLAYIHRERCVYGTEGWDTK